MNARFNMPEFYLGVDIYNTFIHVVKDYPEVLLPNTELHAIFGCFPGCLWNGGGICPSGSITKEQIKDIIEMYNFELGVPLRFTFTNPLVGTTQCLDTYSNIIAELGNNGQNQILTSNAYLERYLRKHYPNYKYCRSIIAARDVPYELHGIDGEYYLSVMQRRKNNDWEYLNTIPMEDRTRIEFLCCDPCPDDCPRLYTHYRDFARAQLECSNGGDECACSMVQVKGEFPNHNMKTNLKTYISRQMIDEKYLPMGFNEFKCSGRSSVSAIILNLLTYMIKPEYRDDMYYKLCGAIGIS